MTLSIRGRISLAFVLISTLALVAGGWLVDRNLTGRFVGERKASLDIQARILAGQVELFLGQDMGKVRSLTASSARLMGVRGLVVDGGGALVADSAGSMDPGTVLRVREVEQALAGLPATRVFRQAREGWVMYAAVPFSGTPPPGAVLLVSDLNAGYGELVAVEKQLALVGLVLLILTTAAGLLFSRLLTRSLPELIAAAVRMGRGDLSARVAVRGRDELGRLARAFNDMAARLEQVEKGRRRFFSDVAHELRTPLATVKVLVEALQTGGSRNPAQMEEYLNDIEQQLARQEALLEDLLRLARSAEKPVSQRSLLKAGEFLARLEAAYRPLAEAKSLEFIAEQKGPAEAGWVDAERLTTAAGNLLANAIAYTQRGYVKLTLYAGSPPEPFTGGNLAMVYSTTEQDRLQSSPEAMFWVLAVEDSGPGLEPEMLPLIFERFYRAEPSRARAYGGAGLGLAIAREAAGELGGSIEVSTFAGRGSRFLLRFLVWQSRDAGAIPG